MYASGRYHYHERIPVPKKAHGRPAKGRARTRKSQRPADTAVVATPELGTAMPTASLAPAAAAAAAVRPRRGAGVPRAAATINYAYLRRDVLTLSVLAPLMVVILIAAFIFLH